MAPSSGPTRLLPLALACAACASPGAAAPGAAAVPLGTSAAETASAGVPPEPAADGAWAGLGPALRDAALRASGDAVPAGDPPPEAPPAGAEDRWRFAVTPYFWLFDMDGTVAKGAAEIPISIHLQDTVDLVQDAVALAFIGHAEAQKGDWSIFLDASYIQLEGEGSASGTVTRRHLIGPVPVRLTTLRTAEIETEVDMSIAEAGVAWRAVEIHLREGVRAPFEILAGGRWNGIDVASDLDVAVTVSGRRLERRFERSFDLEFDERWIDPFVGFRTWFPLADGVLLLVRGDVGGGVGDGSDRAWNVLAGFEFDISERVAAFAGYRWYDFERETHGRETDLQLEGPGVGILIRF